jgi:hypothetical protein
MLIARIPALVGCPAGNAAGLRHREHSRHGLTQFRACFDLRRTSNSKQSEPSTKEEGGARGAEGAHHVSGHTAATPNRASCTSKERRASCSWKIWQVSATSLCFSDAGKIYI